MAREQINVMIEDTLDGRLDDVRQAFFGDHGRDPGRVPVINGLVALLWGEELEEQWETVLREYTPFRGVVDATVDESGHLDVGEELAGRDVTVMVLDAEERGRE